MRSLVPNPLHHHRCLFFAFRIALGGFLNALILRVLQLVLGQLARLQTRILALVAWNPRPFVHTDMSLQTFGRLALESAQRTEIRLDIRMRN